MSELIAFAIIIGAPAFIAGLLIGAALFGERRDDIEPTGHGSRPL